MIAEKLSKNGSIGIFCPSHIAETNRYSRIVETLKHLGFRVTLGENIYKSTYGFVASAKERADDLNSLVANDDVQMVLFGGGENAAEILPLIDYDNIKKHPKLFSSYSDGTSILNAIYSQTGVTTYYGIGTGEFDNLSYYNYEQFYLNFVNGFKINHFLNNSNCISLCGGKCSGTLIGGYAPYFGMMLSNKYFNYNKDSKYILFLEDHEKFSNIGAVSSYLAFIEQSEFFQNVSGMVFGHYSENVSEDFFRCLERLGKRNSIPIIYTDDFGHGLRHGVLPLGVYSELDADSQSLIFYNQDK